MSRERLIVDGYNVLHAHPVLGPLAERDLDAARARLVAELAGFAQGGPKTTVVFDGAGNAASDGAPHHLGALTVIFSPVGKSADTVIESLAARCRERGENAIVATSDTTIRDTVRSGSVSVRSSGNFAEELVADVAEKSAAGRHRTRIPISERIDPEVSSALARWARGSAPGK